MQKTIFTVVMLAKILQARGETEPYGIQLEIFLTSYNDYPQPKIQVDDPDGKIGTRLKSHNFLLVYCESDKVFYSVIQTEKEMWLKSFGLGESKIIDSREK